MRYGRILDDGSITEIRFPFNYGFESISENGESDTITIQLTEKNYKDYKNANIHKLDESLVININHNLYFVKEILYEFLPDNEMIKLKPVLEMRGADDIKLYALREVDIYFKKVVNKSLNVILEERESWSLQYSEANEYLLDNTKKTPLIDSILQYRSEYTKDEFVSKIIDKYNKYTENYGNTLGRKQQVEKLISNSNDRVEIIELYETYTEKRIV